MSGDGSCSAPRSTSPPGLSEAGSLLAAALAASGVLAESLGGGLGQAVLEYRSGPLVLAVAPHAGRRALGATSGCSPCACGRSPTWAAPASNCRGCSPAVAAA